MDSILEDLSNHTKKLYSGNKYKEVEEMFSTFLKEETEGNASLKAKALNNRGQYYS